MIQKPIHPDLVRPPEAADYLGVSVATLAAWRCTKARRVPYLKVGRLIFYRLRDLDRFLVSCEIE
ncbi:MAG: helix-turn-helix domain-containing protein [Lentisphaeria bacterium]|jgi:predicted site-specific integrase-resolvase|nr:helix-turn-helix domain-containing protein [Lentisphaeria bacterium]